MLRCLPLMALLGLTEMASALAVVYRPQTAELVSASSELCPLDRRDGPLYEAGIAFYGIPAERVVRRSLSPPHDSYGREVTGTQHLDASMVRILVDGTDDETCRNLTLAVSNGGRSAPPPGNLVYFTAGGFYSFRSGSGPRCPPTTRRATQV